jgi:CxxC motif-containing protein (DUF1111 family)
MKAIKVLAMVAVWAIPAMVGFGLGAPAHTQGGPTEAPTGFEVRSNGFAEEFCAHQAELAEESPISPRIPDDECSFDAAVEEFTGPEDTAAGLGPIFNGNGCGECHIANQTLGATSQIVERRAGFWNSQTRVFTDHPGGSLIQDRSFRPEEQERVIPSRVNVIALRSTLSVIGDGFVEAIANNTLQGIANNQPSSQRGQVINVPVLEKPGTTRIGRFGHKGQQASLLSFSADAYVNEMGITSPMQPDENTSNGEDCEEPSDAPDGVDDEGVDVALFALFMRSTLAPPRDTGIGNSPDGQAGSTLFNQIGCAVCHTRNITTADPGTLINGGAFSVPAALGNKIIHPFSDFALHNVGTGDGVVQNAGQGTANMMRTPPLWGIRARNRLMLEGLNITIFDSIQLHAGQATTSRNNFNALTAAQRNDLIAFVLSL